MSQEQRDLPAAQRARPASPESETDSDETLLGEKFDFGKTLRSVIRKLQKEDVKLRELGVMFKDLRVIGLGAAASYQPTLASMLNPATIWESIQNARHPPLRDILSGFEGVVRPGEMLLVLGRPGSGCTTLLKTLANQRGDYHAIEGEVHYDSFAPEEIESRYRGDVQYSPEDDVHFPTLTVDETLRFAAKTRTPRNRVAGMSREEYVDTITNILETIFGLKHAKNTPVGDNRVRGVSGGEKKRVSISEALATRSLIGSWDNSTRGLDASTALEFVRALRIASDTMRLTTIVSIYQAGEQLYELFDKVCVINEGKMVYFGPADRARQYFLDLGFRPHNRQTTADFLVSVTDPNGRELQENITTPIPLTATDMAAAFKRSELSQLNEKDIESYRAEFTGKPERSAAYKTSARAEHAKRTRKASPYTITVFMQIKTLMVRRTQILKGSIAEQAIMTLSFVIQAIIVGTVFYNLPKSTSAYFSRGGVLFFSLLFAALSTMSEIPALFGQRPIVFRHNRAAMYHPFVEAVALTVVDVPITFITMLLFSIIIYFLVGLQRTAGQFFIFYLLVFTMTVTMKAWFRFLAASFKSPAPAQTIAGISILALVLYTGYSIPKPSMIGALKWITYINPLRYGYEAIMTNEFYDLVGTCANLVPSGPGYEGVSLNNQACATVGSLPGQNTVQGSRYVSLSYAYYHKYLWRDWGIVLAFGVGFITFLLVATEFNTSLAGQNAVTLFKRGSRAQVLQEAEAATDEEKGKSNASRGQSENLDEKKDAIAAPPMTDVFSWQHLNYYVPVSGGERQLLADVSGYVAPGKLTALMGESGAGKTTLLNVLAERVGSGIVRGDRFVNGQPLPPDFQAQTGYVQQMDTHIANMTVREALRFSADMRQPQSVPSSEKAEYVEKCLHMCGLEAWADAIVGSLGVEHRKRTTIGVELAAKPRLLLFLDEPTSGLDSQSAWAIVQFLRELADSGQAILCTIHQPSAELFQCFDRLLLLKKGGQTVYFGPLGHHSQAMIDYFEGNGARHITEVENPAEYMLDIIGAGATATTDRDWFEVWQSSPNFKATQEEIEVIHRDGRNRPAVEVARHSEYATAWPYQVALLLHRTSMDIWRDPTYLISKFALNIAGGLFIGFTFFQSANSQQGVQNQLFAIYMGCILSVPLAQQGQVPFLVTRGVFEIRERPSRMFSWTALLTAQIIAEIPWNIIGSSLFYLCWYWTVGFNNDRAGYTYLVMCIAFPIYYSTIGQAVAAMSPNAEIASVLFSFLFSFVLTFNGVMQPFRQLGWWKWMYRVSPYTYLIEGVLGQAIGNQLITCSTKELAVIIPPSGQTCSNYFANYIAKAGGYLTNPNATDECHFCSTRTTNEFLEATFNIFYSNHWRDFGLMIVYCAINIAAIYGLTWLFRIRQGSLLAPFKKMAARKSA
ncbi:hypothetical protein PUNSTDRAFT_82390 [Punctularia strigosozonata HHB-11173 SS5]|uniref:uncharacterized protein n=1 Tax=Punctularia strigosozonata (strain HHB-11173) TaxID=741275 RepID=UPI0004418123|nr:uncharacterized protein PUNSTDRAFT_82390 [Punctularia strigosozonata HHB-11173 SS5]EIN12917.1 hypothetical protein PUNSTDRAFT_82390 [Punctularia strigosozonata HHB-11173 SS5]